MTPHLTGVYRADTPDRYDDALAVRRTVFVDEQGVPEALEVDDHEDASLHFVAYDEGLPVGAARLRPDGDGGDGSDEDGGESGSRDGDGDGGADDGDGRTAKVERVAVRREHRGEGWGRRLMDAVEAAAADRGFEGLVLHAQTRVEGFYAGRGYRTVGEEFEEAGIPHVEMVRTLPDRRQ